MVEGIPLDFVKEHAAIAESFVGLPYEVLIRFGRWEDILAAPDHPDFMPLTRAMRFAARGIALAAKGDIVGAQLEQQAYLAAVPLVPAEQTAGPDTRQAILPVVTPMLAGEILYREGRRDEGLAKLREAVKAEDALRYGEPPDWILPARHSLGAALMQERRFAEAEQVYRDASRACRRTAGRSLASCKVSTVRVKRKKPPRPTPVSRKYGLRPTCRLRAPASVSRESEPFSESLIPILE
jgi:hypothetical protein